MKRLMEGFHNNGMTRKQWFYYTLIFLVILPPILMVAMWFWLN